jgi:hypothetical protein
MILFWIWTVYIVFMWFALGLTRKGRCLVLPLTTDTHLWNALSHMLLTGVGLHELPCRQLVLDEFFLSPCIRQFNADNSIPIIYPRFLFHLSPILRRARCYSHGPKFSVEYFVLLGGAWFRYSLEGLLLWPRISVISSVMSGTFLKDNELGHKIPFLFLWHSSSDDM